MPGFLPDTHGRLFTEAGSAPAAGSSATITVPTNTRWRPIAIRCQLTTDATVANRIVSLTLIIGAQVYGFYGSATTQTASLTWLYTFTPQSGINASNVGTLVGVSIPEVMYLDDDLILNVTASGLQAGDQFTAIQVYGERWLEE